MLETILVFALGLVPPLLSLWLMRKAEARARAGLRAAMEMTIFSPQRQLDLPGDRHYVEGLGYLIGDFSCQFNARSSYIRCAVNPMGPCQDCRHYQSKDGPKLEKRPA